MPNEASVPFTKASACGNDFIIIEADKFSGDIAELTKAICDRFRGVGADGVEWIYDSGKADTRAHLINSDGSYAEVSGNGTRCVAAWYCATRQRDQVAIETGAGVKVCTLMARTGAEFHFSADMGTPVVQPPVNMKLKSLEVRGVPVSMGNPHYVIFVDKFPPDWQALATEVQHRTDLFPQSTNVEFVRVVDDSHIEIKIYERGAGETLSSGTGSSASAAAAITVGRTNRLVQVTSPGGPQMVNWQGEQLVLQGPARLVCDGIYYL